MLTSLMKVGQQVKKIMMQQLKFALMVVEAPLSEKVVLVYKMVLYLILT